jgi:hypothetical protein
MNTKPTIRISLTADQKDQIKKLTGKDIPQVKLSLDALEERITPAYYWN